MIRQFELVERIKAYSPNADEDLINRAYVFAMQAHGSQKRASGDPYFSHPLEVAGILTDMKLDCHSIVTALLHDTVEDTEATLDDIERLFGSEVARLVDGVTKLTQLELQSNATKHAENLRKLVLAMSEDIRVLLVKLSDRLHNMRTLHFVKTPEKRARIALETMEIYAPLAERIGMHQLKDELEDWSFKELNSEARMSLLIRLEYLRASGGALVDRIVAELESVLQGANITVTVSGREKAAYSIWRKMQRKNISFEQLSDLIAFRITVNTVEDCYKALGVLHSRYRMVPGRFKDYISTPKPNNYQSIHTSLIGPERQRIEVQMRTDIMHEVAEYGVAAHWSYKQGSANTDGKQYRWLRELLDVLEHASSPEEFLEHTKLAMYQDQVFVFTPKGDLLNLPRGATPVDLAYAIHSELGNICVGTKVNGRIAPLRTLLKNGDQVEILTSKAQTPSPAWEKFVKTAKAKACIRRYIRNQERHQYIELGKSLLKKAFLEADYIFTEKAVEGIYKRFRAQSLDDLYAIVGQGDLSASAVIATIFPGSRETEDPAGGSMPSLPDPGQHIPSSQGEKANLPIRGLVPGMAVHYAECCYPLPGDRIVGITMPGKGMDVHTIDCERLEDFNDTPERWVDLSWDTHQGEEFQHVGQIIAIITNEPGSLGMLCTVIGKSGGNINNLRIIARNTDMFEFIIDVQVKDLKHFTNILAALRASPNINSAERARNITLSH